MTEHLSDPELHRKAAVASFATRSFILFVGISLGLLLIFSAVTVSQIRGQQVSSAGTLKSADKAAQAAEQTANEIHSCVTPGQPCYERSQKQTGAAVSTINRVIILAAACAADLPPHLTVDQRETRITACVTDRLTLAQQKR